MGGLQLGEEAQTTEQVHVAAERDGADEADLEDEAPQHADEMRDSGGARAAKSEVGRARGETVNALQFACNVASRRCEMLVRAR